MRILAIVIITLLAGCQSTLNSIGYALESECKKSYTPSPHFDDEDKDKRKTDPIVILYKSEENSPDSLIVSGLTAMGNGFYSLGSCQFIGNGSQLELTKLHAKKVGADVSISFVKDLGKQWASTQEGGTYSYNIYDAFQTFYRKKDNGANPGHARYMHYSGYIGVITRNLNDKERSTSKINNGVVVIFVTPGSPAYQENIVSGDIITSINHIPVNSQDDFQSISTDSAIQGYESSYEDIKNLSMDNIDPKKIIIDPNPINIEIIRSGEIINKTVERGLYFPPAFP